MNKKRVSRWNFLNDIYSGMANFNFKVHEKYDRHCVKKLKIMTRGAPF